MQKLILGVGLLATSALLMGCPNPNTYGTPRTVPKGQISHTIALEGAYIGGTTTSTSRQANGTVTTNKERVGIGFPMFPSYQLRYGLTDNMDFGVGIKNLSSLQGDFKFNFLRGDIDLAVAPGVQYFGIFTGDNSAHVFYFHLPLIAGFNLSDAFSIVPSVGAVYAAGIVSGTSSSRDSVTSGGGFLFRGGLGLNIRPSATFALQPEVSVMRAFNDAEGLFVVGGIGITIGKHAHGPNEGKPMPIPPAGAAPAGATPAPAGATPAATPAPAGAPATPPPAGVTQ